MVDHESHGRWWTTNRTNFTNLDGGRDRLEDIVSDPRVVVIEAAMRAQRYGASAPIEGAVTRLAVLALDRLDAPYGFGLGTGFLASQLCWLATTPLPGGGGETPAAFITRSIAAIVAMSGRKFPLRYP